MQKERSERGHIFLSGVKIILIGKTIGSEKKKGLREMRQTKKGIRNFNSNSCFEASSNQDSLHLLC
jgi:hypothetical protein